MKGLGIIFACVMTLVVYGAVNLIAASPEAVKFLEENFWWLLDVARQ